MKKVLITGASGFMGTKLVNILSEFFEIIPTDINSEIILDITNKEQVSQMLNDKKPDIVVHTAAYTDVDSCEDNKELAWSINVGGTKNIAEACKDINAKLIVISTDFIFDGKKGSYTEEDTPNPISEYGRTKLEAEKVVKENLENYLIARTCVLYGYNSPKDKQTFEKWVINNLEEGKEIKVVTDQTVSPTLIDDIALAIKTFIEKDAKGVYHLVGSEIISRYDFAVKVQKVFDLPGKIIPFTSAEFKQKANRPMNSSLRIDKLKTLGVNMSSVEEGLLKEKEQMEK